MTPLTPAPIDHWVALDVTSPRKPLRDEMFAAFEVAANRDDPYVRAAWLGAGTGYAVAFGWFTREVLDRARNTPNVLICHPREFTPSPFSDEATAWACGVLYGYYQGTSEGFDATTCAHCGQRLVHDLDYMERCHHGDFCEDHISTWHADSTPAHPGDVCAYEEARREWVA